MSGNVLSKDDNFVPIKKGIHDHSSEKKSFALNKCSSKMLQNLLHFMYKKIHIVGVCFSFRVLHFQGKFLPACSSQKFFALISTPPVCLGLHSTCTFLPQMPPPWIGALQTFLAPDDFCGLIILR